MIQKVLHYVRACILLGHVPSRRALAALFKLHGMRLERRWPFVFNSDRRDLNLCFEDVLEFQYARSRHFTFLIVGAFDGLTNDPISRFAGNHECRGIFVEPQPDAFRRLCTNWGHSSKFSFLNAAVDQNSGTREIYYVPCGIADLPDWAEQLASFRIEHIISHEAKAPGLSNHIRKQSVQTISFTDLLDKFGLKTIDVLQIDAEGLDAQLLGWFPFDRLKPVVVHYEAAHMSPDDHRNVRKRLEGLGYIVLEADSPLDDMAVLIG